MVVYPAAGATWSSGTDIWQSWHATVTTATTTTGTNIDWFNSNYTWTTGARITYNPVQQEVWKQWDQIYTRERETEAQAEARLFAEQERRDQHQRWVEEASARRLAEQARIAGSHERGLQVLDMILTAEERMYRLEHQELMVRGSDGGMFVIEERGVHGNVRETDEHGCLLGRICVAPRMFDHEAGLALPLADGWVGQYLAIKHQEAVFRTTGNWSGVRDCQHPDVRLLDARAA